MQGTRERAHATQEMVCARVRRWEVWVSGASAGVLTANALKTSLGVN